MPDAITTAEAVRRLVDQALAHSTPKVYEAPARSFSAVRFAPSRLASVPEFPVSSASRFFCWKRGHATIDSDCIWISEVVRGLPQISNPG